LNDAKAAVSSDAASTASGAGSAGGVEMASKPFYPEVTVSHVATPSQFYVLELAKKDSLAA